MQIDCGLASGDVAGSTSASSTNTSPRSHPLIGVHMLGRLGARQFARVATVEGKVADDGYEQRNEDIDGDLVHGEIPFVAKKAIHPCCKFKIPSFLSRTFQY